MASYIFSASSTTSQAVSLFLAILYADALLEHVWTRKIILFYGAHLLKETQLTVCCHLATFEPVTQSPLELAKKNKHLGRDSSNLFQTDTSGDESHS